MTAQVDRALIAALVDREMAHRPEVKNVSRLAVKAGVHRNTVTRALNPEEWDKTERSTLRSIEGALGFPVDTFALVGKHDWQALLDEGMDPQTISWLQRTMGKMSNPVDDVSKTN